MWPGIPITELCSGETASASEGRPHQPPCLRRKGKAKKCFPACPSPGDSSPLMRQMNGAKITAPSPAQAWLPPQGDSRETQQVTL